MVALLPPQVQLTYNRFCTRQNPPSANGMEAVPVVQVVECVPVVSGGSVRRGSVRSDSTETTVPPQPTRARPDPDVAELVEDEEVVETARGGNRQGAAKGKAQGAHLPWTEQRLLSLIQTASTVKYAEVYFRDKILSYGTKMATMVEIRETLQQDQAMWPRVPLDRTIDKWLNDAVERYIRVSRA